MERRSLRGKRSFTGHHSLLPASTPPSQYDHIHRPPKYTLISWTFGRGSVIWRIWPAVLLHTLVAVAVVIVSFETKYHVELPNVMLTVLGVVIGFVISYRASSGYDRYWLGRSCWSEIMRNARTLGRLVWFHVPPRLSPKTSEENASGTLKRTKQEMIKVMSEKRLALDLIEGFAVALKHHIRGELGIYFEDLYYLVRPLHPKHDRKLHTARPPVPPRKAPRIIVQSPLTHQPPSPPNTVTPPPGDLVVDTVTPPINGYGALDNSNAHSQTPPRRQVQCSHSSTSLGSHMSHSTYSPNQPLLPSPQRESDGVMNKVSGDLIPFMSFFSFFRGKLSKSDVEASSPTAAEEVDQFINGEDGGVQRKWGGPLQSARLIYSRDRPRIAGEGQNLPLEILRCLSEWCSVLEDRGTVAGTSLSLMIMAIGSFEDNLSALERILTTPLPFVYAVHISTVWIYLFLLPFQLVSQFGWYTIPGVFIAAFIYLGFLAAGEEIEQPFGYDDNDLDLDLFCREVIHADVVHLKMTPCLNAYLGTPRHQFNIKPTTLGEVSERVQEEYDYSDDEASL